MSHMGSVSAVRKCCSAYRSASDAMNLGKAGAIVL